MRKIEIFRGVSRIANHVSLAEVGMYYGEDGVSRERIRQIEASANLSGQVARKYRAAFRRVVNRRKLMVRAARISAALEQFKSARKHHFLQHVVR